MAGRPFKLSRYCSWAQDRATPKIDVGRATRHISELFRPSEPVRRQGRPEKPQTVGERRLDMLEIEKLTLEQIAEREGYDIAVIERSIARGRKRRRLRQSGQ